MAVPKKKTSPSRRGMRRSADALKRPTYIEDKDSGELRRPHHIDLKTGMYKGCLLYTSDAAERRAPVHAGDNEGEDVVDREGNDQQRHANEIHASPVPLETSLCSGFLLHLENLPAPVHAGLQIDVVRTAQLTRILVLDIRRLLERIRRSAHAAPRRRGFSFWNSHGELLKRRAKHAKNGIGAGLIDDEARRG